MKKEAGKKKSTGGKKTGVVEPVKKMTKNVVRKASNVADKVTPDKRANRKGVINKVQELIDDNEETIHLVLEIAALTIQKSKMSDKNKRISKAALALIAEITSPEGTEIDKEFPILMHNN